MAASPTTAETNVTSPSGLLIFDGDCGFCTKTARLFGDFAGDAAEVAPWQALNLDDYGLTKQDCATAAFWVQDGVAYRAVDGFAKGLQVCKQPWPVVGKIMSVPPVSWVAKAIYPIVAKYRYRLPGSTDACRIN